MSPMLVESHRLQSSSVTGRSLRLIALGGICGADGSMVDVVQRWAIPSSPWLVTADYGRSGAQ